MGKTPIIEGMGPYLLTKLSTKSTKIGNILKSLRWLPQIIVHAISSEMVTYPHTYATDENTWSNPKSEKVTLDYIMAMGSHHQPKVVWP
jgi:hypothetical protein